MANHTYCRAKALAQNRCTAAEALAIVENFLDSDSALLADDLRVNLHNVSKQLEVLKECPEALKDVGKAANVQNTAALTPGADAPAPGTAPLGKKKEQKRLDKAKVKADGPTGGKEEAAPGTASKADKVAKKAGESKDGSKKDKRDKGGKGSKKDEGQDGGKAEKSAKKDKERKKEEGSRKRAAEEVKEGGPDTVRKAKKQKVKA